MLLIFSLLSVISNPLIVDSYQIKYLTSYPMRAAPLARKPGLMLVRSGDLLHCTNPACLSKLSIGTIRDAEVDDVYCVCGAVMKKHYLLPGFLYLDFLREREQDALHELDPDPGPQNARNE
jgi:hypothetical protein